jgi:hypothetical protein
MIMLVALAIVLQYVTFEGIHDIVASTDNTAIL